MPTMTAWRATAGVRHEPCTVVMFRTLAEDSLLKRVRGEFREMPGMRLTLAQAMRLWMLDDPTCSRVLESLVQTRFLEVDATGRYRRALYPIEHTVSNGRVIRHDWQHCGQGPGGEDLEGIQGCRE